MEEKGSASQVIGMDVLMNRLPGGNRICSTCLGGFYVQFCLAGILSDLPAFSVVGVVVPEPKNVAPRLKGQQNMRAIAKQGTRAFDQSDGIKGVVFTSQRTKFTTSMIVRDERNATEASINGEREKESEEKRQSH